MKNHLTKLRNKQNWRKVSSLSIVAIASLLAVTGSLINPTVYATSIDEQIRALDKQVANNQGSVNALRAQAQTYEEAIANLRAQINDLQSRIDANTARQADLQRQIDAAQQELERQRKVLGDTIKAMYVEGQISTIEILATSKDLSDFVDRQEYHSAVETKIQETLKRISELQLQLKDQKTEVEGLLIDQRTQQGDLTAKRSEQAGLLNYNQQQQGAYTQQMKADKARIEELRAQQRAANLRAGGGASYGSNCGGGYSGPWPNWCNDPLDEYVDKWGMYTRECVSYTAFKVWQSGRYMPYWGGVGNANQWDDNARAAGIPVDSSPRVGDVAVWHIGTYGHVMYVESVSGNGDIIISEYNYDWTGRYSERSLTRANWEAQNFVFIHFR